MNDSLQTTAWPMDYHIPTCILNQRVYHSIFQTYTSFAGDVTSQSSFVWSFPVSEILQLGDNIITHLTLVSKGKQLHEQKIIGHNSIVILIFIYHSNLHTLFKIFTNKKNVYKV